MHCQSADCLIDQLSHSKEFDSNSFAIGLLHTTLCYIFGKGNAVVLWINHLCDYSRPQLVDRSSFINYLGLFEYIYFAPISLIINELKYTFISLFDPSIIIVLVMPGNSID